MSDKLSVFISLILRHKPDVIDIHLDRFGYADTKELINGINKHGQYKIDIDTLVKIVNEDKKTRYSFNEDKTKIRANQGHSIDVQVELKELTPPDILYHGTAEKSLENIRKDGITKRSRLYVHLSSSDDIAIEVGRRHGKPVVLEIDAKKMIEDGFKFYLSENKVWLTEVVPNQYIIENPVSYFINKYNDSLTIPDGEGISISEKEFSLALEKHWNKLSEKIED